MGNGSEFPNRGDSQGDSSGAQVSEHLDLEVLKQLSDIHGLTSEDDDVYSVEREDHEDALRKAAEAAAAADAKARQDAAEASKGTPVTVKVGPTAPVPTPAIFAGSTRPTAAPTPKAPTPAVTQPTVKQQPSQQPEITSLDDIEQHLSGIDVNESTQPVSPEPDKIAGRALRGRFGSARRQRQRMREEESAKINALRPEEPKPTVPQPGDPEPASPIVIKDVIKEKPPVTKPAPENKASTVEDDLDAQLQALVGASKHDQELVAVTTPKPEAAPAKPEVVRPGRERHNPTHADDLHAVHNDRKTIWNRIGTAFSRMFTEEVPVAQADAETPVAPAAENLQSVASEASAPTEPQAPKLDTPEAVKPQAARKKPEAKASGDESAVHTTAESKDKAWGVTLESKNTAADLEAYKNARPSKPEGESYIRRSVDKNGRPIFFDQDGVQVSEAVYDKFLYGQRRGTASPSTEYYAQKREKGERDAVHGEALSINGQMDERDSAALRRRLEGEKILARDEDLQGLMGLGQELLGLKNAKAEGQEELIATRYKQKRKMFDDLVELYRSRGVDARGIDYVLHETTHPIDHPNYNPIQGSAYVNGEKVKVLDYIESPDGKQSAYTIEMPDGTVTAQFGQNVEFKRDIQGAPEASAEELSKIDKLKNWVKGIGPGLREISGKAFFKTIWKLEDGLLSRGTKGLEGKELEQKREKNRRAFAMGTTVLAVGIVATSVLTHSVNVVNETLASAQDAIMNDGFSQAGFGLGFGEGAGASAGFEADAASVPSWDANFDSDYIDPSELDANQPDVVLEAEGVVDTEPHGHWDENTEIPADTGMENPAYNIAEGQGGIKLFSNLGLSETAWYENAGTLAQLFPQDFRAEGSDVWISHSGPLSYDARQYIEAIRTR